MSRIVADYLRSRAAELTATSSDVLASRTYLYPPMGIAYLLTHRTLWPPVTSRILPCIALSTAVLIPMFLVAYVPQAAILTLLNGPLGPLNAIALVLSESTLIITSIARAFLLERALIDVFDATLVCEGQERLVAEGREVRPGSKLQGVKKLGSVISKPLQRFSPAHVLQYLIMLPLNLIPIVGTTLFLVIQGRKIAPSFHARYFQLKHYDAERKRNFITKNQGSYTAFGTIAMFLNLVPFASLLFTFTSTVGAALWAVEIEKGEREPVQVVGSDKDNGKEL